VEGRKRPSVALCGEAGGGEQRAGGVEDSGSEIQISIQRTNRFFDPLSYKLVTGWQAPKRDVVKFSHIKSNLQ